MALTPEGTPYVESSDLVANYPAASLSLANRVDLVGVLPFATSAARATAIPSPTDGQYSYLQDTNSTEFWNGSAWVAAGTTPGLAKITDVALSGASVSVNSCFTSTYTNYRIVVNVVSSTFSQPINFRLRVSGSDNTSTNYRWARVGINSLTDTTYNAANGGGSADKWELGLISTGNVGLSLDVISPQAATQTAALAMYSQAINGPAVIFTYFDAATQFDGFTIYPNSGTFSSGSVRVYGYAN